jgi:hypothetical protein
MALGLRLVLFAIASRLIVFASSISRRSSENERPGRFGGVAFGEFHASLPILPFDRLGDWNVSAPAVLALLEPIKTGQIASCHCGSSHFQTPFGSHSRFIVNS